MFNWSENITLPTITDAINISDLPVNVLRLFTYMWVWFLGGWFFAGVIGVLGAALYVKYDNAMVPGSFLIIMVILFGGLFTATTGTPVASAEIVLYVIGMLVAFVIGMGLYMLFINKGD